MTPILITDNPPQSPMATALLRAQAFQGKITATIDTTTDPLTAIQILLEGMAACVRELRTQANKSQIVPAPANAVPLHPPENN